MFNEDWIYGVQVRAPQRWCPLQLLHVIRVSKEITLQLYYKVAKVWSTTLSQANLWHWYLGISSLTEPDIRERTAMLIYVWPSTYETVPPTLGMCVCGIPMKAPFVPTCICI